jgi:hypothetical protein
MNGIDPYAIPAFAALRPGGDLTWLQYELAVPLAMNGVAILLPGAMLFLNHFAHGILPTMT